MLTQCKEKKTCSALWVLYRQQQWDFRHAEKSSRPRSQLRSNYCRRQCLLSPGDVTEDWQGQASLFVPIIKLGKRQWGIQSFTHPGNVFVRLCLPQPLRKKKIKTYVLPYRGFCFCSSRKKKLLSTLINMLLRKSGKSKSFAAVYSPENICFFSPREAREETQDNVLSWNLWCEVFKFSFLFN